MKHRDVFQSDPLTHEFDSVFVLQSLRPGDRKTGEDLYDLIVRPITHSKSMHCRLFISRSKADFVSHLDQVLEEVRRNSLAPIVQIDVHGSESGMEVSGGEFVAWEEIRGVLTDINRASGFNLLVVLAACSGIYLQNILVPTRPAPAWGLIGPTDTVPEDEVEAGFRAFYSEYLQSADPKSALEALNGATLGAPWSYGFRSASNLFREAVREYILGFLDPATEAPRLAEFAAAIPLLNQLDEVGRKQLVRDQLIKHSFFVERFAARFFMYDQFPENADRFRIDVPKLAKELADAWSAAA